MKDLIVVRGGGDLATGTIYKLYKCGFKVLILECEKPSAIRRNVAFSEAVYEGTQQVEDVTCYLAKNIEEVIALLNANKLVVYVDEKATCIDTLKPFCVVDAILAKRNLGTSKQMAPITIALGPGFIASEDVDAIVETNRGHFLGKVLYEGSAIANTGIPGLILGYGKERVIHAPTYGVLTNVKRITDVVKKGEVIAKIRNEEEEVDVLASMDGLLRGLIRDQYVVTKGFKIADIDPRLDEYENCFTISDKARCIAGGVLEAILTLQKEKKL